MSSWAERVHRRAADLGSVVTSCGHPGSSTPAYPYRLEKVKFGVPLEEVCKNNDNIPGPLLVLILKLNKESPNRRDVFRAPGHQGAMKKLVHFLQTGRLVNVDNYSVYTIASVLKKFLRKIPNGIFGRSGEKELFAIIELDNEAEQTERLHRLFTTLPKYTQHLLVLLFGTFRVIASNAAPAATGMTSEALGVSVAPSFFQSCVSDGKTARMEDVLKFKVATKIMKHIIDKFATNDLFGRENYEYYARVTGRILKVQDEWICSFQYPPPPRGKLAQQKYALQHSLEAEKTWLQCQCERWGLLAQEESRSTPALLTSSSSAVDNSVLSLGVTPEHTFIESCARLSVSLEGPGLFAMTSSPLPKRNSIRGDELLIQHRQHQQRGVDDDDDDDDDDFTVGEGELDDDDDEDNYADDDDDHDDDNIDLRSYNNDRGGHDTEDILAAGQELSHEQRQQLTFQTLKPKPTVSSKKKQMRKTAIVAANAGLVVGANAKVSFNDNEDDDEGEGDAAVAIFGKRRYRPNKKKTTIQARSFHQQHTRRFRGSSKIVDGSEHMSGAKCVSSTSVAMENQRFDSFVASKSKTTKTSTSKSGASARTANSSSTNALRTCSRCNRGIRHSSSCSSTSGGASGGINAGANSNGNNSSMTMEELRAVNRYAESTKSLSYLPQVHERQTARMITRSEWFLSGTGPGDDMTLELPNACSNCCLLAATVVAAAAADTDHQNLQRRDQHIKVFLKQHRPFYYPQNYLGGGSTRDMRPRTDEFGGDNEENYMTRDGGSGFYLFHKQRQQKPQQQHVLQPQQQLNFQFDDILSGIGDDCFHSNDMHMDTNDNTVIEQRKHQNHQIYQYNEQQEQQQQQQNHPYAQGSLHSPSFPHSSSTGATYLSPSNLLKNFSGSGEAGTSKYIDEKQQQKQQHHTFLDIRTGSYVASNCNNCYNFNTTIINTTRKTAITTNNNTTTTSTTSTLKNFTNDSNFENNIEQNINHQIKIHHYNKENKNKNKNNNNDNKSNDNNSYIDKNINSSISNGTYTLSENQYLYASNCNKKNESQNKHNHNHNQQFQQSSNDQNQEELVLKHQHHRHHHLYHQKQKQNHNIHRNYCHHYEQMKRNSLDLTSCDGQFVVVSTKAMPSISPSTLSPPRLSPTLSQSSNVEPFELSYNHHHKQHQQHHQQRQQQPQLIQIQSFPKTQQHAKPRTPQTTTHKRNIKNVRNHRCAKESTQHFYYEFDNNDDRNITECSTRTDVVANAYELISSCSSNDDRLSDDKHTKTKTEISPIQTFPFQKQYHSPRKQQLMSEKRLTSSNCALSCTIPSIVDNEDSDSVKGISSTVNPKKIATTSVTVLRSETPCIGSTAAANVMPIPEPIVAAEEVDYVLTSRFRHSTPVSQRRRLTAVAHRQRSSNMTSSPIRLFPRRSSNADIGSNNGANNSSSSATNNNLVTVIFNVLDFLF